MNPGPRIRPFTSKESRAYALDLLPKHREINTLRPARSSALPIDIRWADNASLQLLSMISCRRLNDLVDVAMELWIRTRSDFVDIVDIGPDFWIQLAKVCWCAPVCQNACAAQMDEEAR